MGKCRDCDSCLELCPEVFRRNEQTGRIEVLDLSEYPEERIHEAISMCPDNCIGWEEVKETIEDRIPVRQGPETKGL